MNKMNVNVDEKMISLGCKDGIMRYIKSDYYHLEIYRLWLYITLSWGNMFPFCSLMLTGQWFGCWGSFIKSIIIILSLWRWSIPSISIRVTWIFIKRFWWRWWSIVTSSITIVTSSIMIVTSGIMIIRIVRIIWISEKWNINVLYQNKNILTRTLTSHQNAQLWF